MLRLTLRSGTRVETTLAEELALLRRYAEIQETRYGERLRVCIRRRARGARRDGAAAHPPAAGGERDPPRHHPPDHARVGWTCARGRTQGRLHLVVRDDGVGLGARGPSREGVGLSITRARLRQLYGAAQRVELSPAPRGGTDLRPGDPAPAAPRRWPRDRAADPRPHRGRRAAGAGPAPDAARPPRRHAGRGRVRRRAARRSAPSRGSRPDVVFLDIEMTETSGLDVAARLGGEPLPAVVFVTAHERYAPRGVRRARARLPAQAVRGGALPGDARPGARLRRGDPEPALARAPGRHPADAVGHAGGGAGAAPRARDAAPLRRPGARPGDARRAPRRPRPSRSGPRSTTCCARSWPAPARS